MSLYANINKRKKAGTSRTKKNSTISNKAYANMKAGFPKSKNKKKKKAQLEVIITLKGMSIIQFQAIQMDMLLNQHTEIQPQNLNKKILLQIH